MSMQTQNTGKSALGLDGNVAALLGYIIWIIALISLIMEKENRFVRFHAIQALLYNASFIVIYIALGIIQIIITIVFGVAAAAAGDAGGAIGIILWLISALIWMVVPLIMLIGIILTAIKAYQGQMYKLPVIGNMAEKWASA
jgi:uncharacterized membrane protein